MNGIPVDIARSRGDDSPVSDSTFNLEPAQAEKAEVKRLPALDAAAAGTENQA